MISERKLKKWRKEALQFKLNVEFISEDNPIIVLCEYVIEMTQLLLDQYLLQEKVKETK